jgi:hypothetical protein
LKEHHLFFSIISIYNKLAEFMLNRWKLRQIRQNRLKRCILYFATVGPAGSVSALCLFLALLNFIKVQISQAEVLVSEVDEGAKGVGHCYERLVNARQRLLVCA